jgi:dynein heavy chain, axonemal
MSDKDNSKGDVGVEPPLVSITKQPETKQQQDNVAKPLGKTILKGDKNQEMLKNLKALKDERRSRLDGRYEHITSKLADSVGIDQSIVEDMILGDERFDQIDSFFDANGRKVLMFYYQEPSNDTNQTQLNKNQSNKKRFIVTTGEQEALSGVLYYFVRTSNVKPLTSTNISQDTYFGILDCQNGKLLESVERMLGCVMIPALTNLEDWGSLKTSNNPEVQTFLESLERFAYSINGAKSNMGNQVKLAPCNHDNTLSNLNSVSDYQSMSQNRDFLQSCEDILAAWCKQIAKVLIESEQIRREADDSGPYSEFSYWKERMAKFNNLLEQIKAKRVRAVIGILQAAKSKSLNKWKEMDAKITDAANEARDNVKYLYTLDTFFSSMTKFSPAVITESIPNQMNAVRMICSISQYYNSSERMTSLFLKITNQMISTCKKYIREGYSKIWEIPKVELLERISQSKNLFNEYQRNFRKTREKLKTMENERQWDFSENYIFGKFDAFCKRLNKIADVITTIDNLSCLNVVKLEGLESVVVKYKNIAENIKKKNYDILDHRKPEFDNDYNDFKNQIEGLQYQLQNFIDTWSRNSYTTEQSLEFLEKIQRLDGIKIDYNSQYLKLLQEYSKELDAVKKLYEKNKVCQVFEYFSLLQFVL